MNLKYTVILMSLILGMVFISSCQNTKKNKTTVKSKSENEPTYLIVLAGQSNMVGAGLKKEIDTITVADHIKYYNYGMSSKRVPASDKSFGPELGISRVLSTNYLKGKFILVKYAVGGSSMYDWAVEYDKQLTDKMGTPMFGRLYDSLLHYTQAVKTENIKPLALVWMQGETDARFVQAGNAYYQNLSLLIKQLRMDLGEKDLPVLIGKINPLEHKYPGAKLVKNAQDSICRTIENTYLIPTKGLEKHNDQLHYSSNGQLELGYRFASVLDDLLQQQEKGNKGSLKTKSTDEYQ